jgi:hypothetical protein
MVRVHVTCCLMSALCPDVQQALYWDGPWLVLMPIISYLYFLEEKIS